MNKKNIEFLKKENLNLSNKFESDPLKKYRKILLVGFTGLLGINILISLINFKKKFNNKKKIVCINSGKINKNLNKFISQNKINNLQIDITKNFKLNEKFDLIIFSAGYSSPSKFMKEGEKTILTHSVGLKNISSYLTKKHRLYKIA